MKLWILQQPFHGGAHYEHQRFQDEARILGIDLEIVAPEAIDLIVSRGGRRSIRLHGQEVDLPDAVLPRMGSATNYFCLAVLRQFEHLGVAVLNPSSAIEAVKDKLFCQQILAQNNLPIPRTILVRFPVDLDLVESQIGFPCVVKVLAGSAGEGIYLSHNSESFRNLMELVSCLDQSKSLILQEYIDSRPGQDLRVMVIGGRVVGAMLRSSTDGSFKANITRGGIGKAYPIDDTIDVLARECASALGLEIAGIDLLFDGGLYRICEANSAPGFKGFENATGTNIARQILQYCHWKIRRQLAEPILPPIPLGSPGLVQKGLGESV